jgi:glycosyltransferase involved in cell wall biosynthesis
MLRNKGIVVLVNALSVTNQSGLHVLAGHLEQLAKKYRLIVIARPNDAIRSLLGGSVEWINAPEKTAGWLHRALWEFQCLGKAAKNSGAGWYFTPSGIAASRLSIPQVVLCQNPWAMVPSARRKKDALKAWLQRRAYRKTMRIAEVMVFNSHYMQRAYRENAGFHEKNGIIATQAAEEETRRRAEAWKGRSRVPGQICCVSAMAPHKNVEALIRAFAKLTSDLRPPISGLRPRTSDLRPPISAPTLHLVGPWPDSAYEQKILHLITDLGLNEQVQVHGFVSREELDRIYAESQVFCLMSRCESFGIPAIEAQLFGTPVVCSTACAVPEICGEGGLFCDPDDVEGVASALRSLLSDSTQWKKMSERALENAVRFRWEECSRPLANVFEQDMNCC